MPYIDWDARNLYDTHIEQILYTLRHTEATDAAGHMTYIVFRLLRRFSGRFWMRALGVGCLLMAILEIYRRDHVDYENEKILMNGDVRE